MVRTRVFKIKSLFANKPHAWGVIDELVEHSLPFITVLRTRKEARIFAKIMR